MAADPTHAAVFAYESGASLVGTSAPARRVGFFFFENTVVRMKSEAAWKLFEQAARWAAGIPAP